MQCLRYDPGVIPTRPAPLPGEYIVIEVDGYPPHKDEHRSIRNSSHPQYSRFMALREAAIKVMGGRAWSHGPIRLDFVLFAPSVPQKPKLRDFDGGIEDTLDGSSGFTFTYLPIVFEDDCQIVDGTMRYVVSDRTRYRVVVTFLNDEIENNPPAIDPDLLVGSSPLGAVPS